MKPGKTKRAAPADTPKRKRSLGSNPPTKRKTSLGSANPKKHGEDKVRHVGNLEAKSETKSETKSQTKSEVKSTHSKKGAEDVKPTVSPTSLKEALKQKRNPMGGPAVHTHGRKHGLGDQEDGDPAHPHHHKHHHGPGKEGKTHHKHHHHHHHRAQPFMGHAVVEHDEEHEHEEDVYEITLAKKAVRAFLPLRILLALGGRFPLTISRNSGDGTYTYKCNWALPHGVFFIFTTVLMVALSLTVLVNYATYKTHIYIGDYLKVTKWKISWTDDEHQQVKMSESAVVDRHLMVFVVLFCNLINGIIGSFNIIRKRRFLVRYFVFWTEATEKLYMDVGQGLFTYSCVLCIVFIGFIGGLTALYATNIGTTSRGGPTLIGFLLFRTFTPSLFLMRGGDLIRSGKRALANDTTYRTSGSSTFNPIMGYYRITGVVVLLFTFLWSKSLLLIFLFKCKLLVNAFGVWNGRVYATVLRGREYNLTEDGRAAYKILFKDHCILLDLLEGTDRFFSLILECFFGLHITSLMVEMYFVLLFLRSANDSNLERQAAEVNHYFVRRRFEWISGFLIAAQNIFFLYMVSVSAADVGDEAAAGLEVVRRKTMLGRRTDEELYFNFSLYYSYTAYKGCIMRAGGYFDLNKDFMIGIFSVFLSYYIILQQFAPNFDTLEGPNAADFNTRGRIGIFLYKLEGLNDCHWVNKESLIKDPHGCNIPAP